MKGLEYIKRTRRYLDYLENHIKNVHKAFDEVSVACKHMQWVTDDYIWHTIRAEIEFHDVSKFSQEEFVPYREKFFPVVGEIPNAAAFKAAWEHHKKHNSHHHETARTEMDIVHMVVDWTAMGYRFGNTAEEYYEKIKSKLSEEIRTSKFLQEIFAQMRKARGEK